jgi:phage replication-related protein YjqB (UPF0714/DUF867 family)
MHLDKYASLAALQEHEGKNAYRIRSLDRKSPVTIISPHGGFIEPGTSAIANAVAGRKHNLFDFQGLRRENAEELHVTATHFREPRLTALLSASSTAVSIHDMGKQDCATIWLGGLNYNLKQITLEQLRRYRFNVNPDSPLYRGESPHNVVNLAANHGVQLELSRELISDLFDGEPFLLAGARPQMTMRCHQLILALRISIRQATSSTLAGC